MKIESAEYHSAILPEDEGNPLIEALPAKVDDEEIIKNLGCYPPHSDDERKYPPIERVEYLRRLGRLRQPQPVYLELFRAIEMSIKDGLSSKNPFSPTTMNYLSYSVQKKSAVEPLTGYFQPKGSGITVIGESGVGKTCMIEQVLNYFPDTIIHTKYKNEELPLRQVVWVKVDCPENSSIKALCHKIIKELDSKLEFSPTVFASTIADLKMQIEAKVKSSFLGILVIDEMQNLNLAKSGGDDQLIAFLHTLVNDLGVPLLFCANPPFNELLAKTLKTARRSESNGSFEVDLLTEKENWDLFIKELWKFQWTKKKTKLTNKLNQKLHQLSIGNMELAVRIYRETQRQLIGTKNERITEEVLEYAAVSSIKISSSQVNQILKDNISAFKRDNPINDKPQSKPTSVAEDKELVSIPIGLDRVHHAEFANKILELDNKKDLFQQIQDPDLLRRTLKVDNPLDELRKHNILCDNPLLDFE